MTFRGRSSFLVGFDPKTGKEKWRQIRASRARGESLEAYSTPTPMTYNKQKEIIVAGGDCLTGHDPESGREIWRWGTWNRNRTDHWRMVASPVHGGHVVLGCAPKGERIFAVWAGRRGTMRITQTSWITEKKRFPATSRLRFFYRGLFYFLNGRKGILSCVDPFTGAVAWSEELGARAKMEASPTAADGKIFLLSHTGEVFVVKASDEYELLHSAILGQDIDATNRASIVPVNGKLLIRISDQLWCMSKEEE